MNLEEEISQGEGEQLEFKRSLSKDDSKWLKTVVAFANGRGGKIVFGIETDGSIVGVTGSLFETKDAIADAVANRINPMPPISLSVTSLGDKPLIVLEVAQGMQCPYYLKSKGDSEGVYVRYDATTRQVDEDGLRELRLEGSGRSFDCLPCRGAKVTAKEIAALCKALYRTARENAKNDAQRDLIKPPTAAQLVKWGVLVERGGELRPTWAFILLAGRDEMQPKMKCGIFKGNDRSIFVDRRQFDAPVQEQAEKAYQYVLEKINLGARINGLYREDVYEIPPDAIREIIINAVVHRSYFNGDASPITVALYDNRLEITSPGGLVRGMTLEKMLNGSSDCRNRALAEAFAYMNLIENWGSGVKRYVASVKAAGLREPEFIVWSNAIRINLYRTDEDNHGTNEDNEDNVVNVGNNVANDVVNVVNKGDCPHEDNGGVNEDNEDNLKTILLAVKTNPNSTVRSLANGLPMSKSTIERALKALQNTGRIRRVGGTRGHWEVV